VSHACLASGSEVSQAYVVHVGVGRREKTGGVYGNAGASQLETWLRHNLSSNHLNACSMLTTKTDVILTYYYHSSPSFLWHLTSFSGHHHHLLQQRKMEPSL